MTDSVRAHLQAAQAVALSGADGDLPPHYPTCFGCGPEAAQGMHLRVRREGEEIVADYAFEQRHAGAPGIVHGGLVATVLDDMMGFLAYVVKVPSVTRHLSVDYLAPALIGVPYVLRARLERRDGRKLFNSCTATDPDGRVAFRAEALFLAVPGSHFREATSGGGQAAVAP